MHILLRINADYGEHLILAQTIFPRPTPWHVFFQVAVMLPFGGRDSVYRCVSLPDDVAENMEQYTFQREGNYLYYKRCNEKELIENIQIQTVTFRRFLVGMLESIVYGTTFRFSQWSWGFTTTRCPVVSNDRTQRIEEDDDET